MKGRETEFTARRPLRGWRLTVFIILLAGGTATAIAAGILLAGPVPRALVYERRIRSHTCTSPDCQCLVIQRSLDGLAGLKHPLARSILESLARDGLHHWRQRHALIILLKRYPSSEIARGSAEYAEITGHSYFDFWEQTRLDASSAARLEAWMGRHPTHPAVDDACLLLGIREMDEGRPTNALEWFERGLRSPDGDSKYAIHRRIRECLARRCSGEELERWLLSSCPVPVVPDATYVAGVQRLRERRYAAALSHFEGFLAMELPAQPEFPWSSRPADVRKMCAEQAELCGLLLAGEEAIEDEEDPGAKASLLHAQGKLCFEKHALFKDAMTGSRWSASDPRFLGRGSAPMPPPTLVQHGYEQAMEYFEEIARCFPEYPLLEDVEYSIPLCLWRMRSELHRTMYTDLDAAIYPAFQAFAEKYPRSSMADDALYLAGLHHWESTGRINTTILHANMARIARDYPDGDIVARYGASNPWLREALRLLASTGSCDKISR